MIKLRPRVEISPNWRAIDGGARIDVVGIPYRREACSDFIDAAAAAYEDGRAIGVMARREPQNRYDGNAIAIDGFIGTPGRSRATHLGYLPSDVAIRLRSRETQATLANLYKGDDGFMDIEVVVACPAEVEDHLADFDQEARRTWMREICMPGLKILAHIAAVDGSTEAAERGQMEKFARAAALLAQASIPDGLISGAVQDAIGMEPSLAAVRANYKKVTKNDDAAAIVLEFAASLAKEGGVNAQERKVLEMILRAEGKA